MPGMQCVIQAFSHKLATPVDVRVTGGVLGYADSASVTIGSKDVLRGIDAKLKAEPDGDRQHWPIRSWGQRNGALICAERLLDAKSLMAACKGAARLIGGVRIDAMPMFVPLLQPATACGKPLAEAFSRTEAASAGYWEKKEVGSASQGSRCVKSPYKEVLQRVFSELAKEPEGSAARALSGVMAVDESMDD